MHALATSAAQSQSRGASAVLSSMARANGGISAEEFGMCATRVRPMMMVLSQQAPQFCDVVLDALAGHGIVAARR